MCRSVPCTSPSLCNACKKDPDAADADTNNTVNGGGDAGNSGANADSTRTGEDLPFIGDEIKFVHDVIDLIAARRGGDDGGHGGGGRGFVKDVGDSFPDDMKVYDEVLEQSHSIVVGHPARTNVLVNAVERFVYFSSSFQRTQHGKHSSRITLVVRKVPVNGTPEPAIVVVGYLPRPQDGGKLLVDLVIPIVQN